MYFFVLLWLNEHQLRKYKELYETNIDMIKQFISKCEEFKNWKQEYTRRRKSKMEGGGVYYMVLIPDENNSGKYDISSSCL